MDSVEQDAKKLLELPVEQSLLKLRKMTIVQLAAINQTDDGIKLVGKLFSHFRENGVACASDPCGTPGISVDEYVETLKEVM